MVQRAVDGPFLREERVVRGWTIDGFATEVGISRQYLTDIEAGRRKLSRRPDLVRRMAQVLELPMTKLYREDSVA